MGYVKLVGTRNRHTSWVSEVVLETDDNGNPTKSVRRGVPTDLSDSDQKQLEAQGFVLDKSSKSEADEYAEQAGPVVGSDVAAAAPVFGSSEAPDQQADVDQSTGDSND